MAEVKRGRGRPEKLKHTDAKAILAKIKDESDKFDARTADQLAKIYKKIEDVAFSGMVNGSKASPKDQIIMLNFLRERLEKRLEDSIAKEEAAAEVPKEDATEEEKPVAKLIDLNFTQKEA